MTRAGDQPAMHRDAVPTVVEVGHADKVDERVFAEVYRCGTAWDELQPTENPQVRHCTRCTQSVFAIRDRAGLMQAIAAGKCVMLMPVKGSTMYVGAVASAYKTESSD